MSLFNPTKSEFISAVFRLIYDDNTEQFNKVINSGKIDVNTKDQFGQSFLFVACQYNRVEMVNTLLSFPYIEVNKPNANRVSPLWTACASNNVKVVELLLTHFNSKYKIIVNGKTPVLPYLCLNGKSIEIIKLLLKHSSIDVNVKTGEHKLTPFLSACLSGYSEAVKLLLQHPNINTTIKSKYNGNAFNFAVFGGIPETVELLFSHPEIDVNNVGIVNYTKKISPLQLACDFARIEILQLLLTHPKIKNTVKYKIDKRLNSEVTTILHNRFKKEPIEKINNILDSILD